jgi:hypothetical protein
MDLTEIGLGSVDWIQLAQDRNRWRAVVNTVMNPRVLAPRSYLVCAFNDTCFRKPISFSCLLYAQCLCSPPSDTIDRQGRQWPSFDGSAHV